MDMLLSRNALAHTYDAEQFMQIVVKVKEQYIGALDKTYRYFMNKELEVRS